MLRAPLLVQAEGGVFGQPGSQAPRATVRELARGSGFPDSFELPPQQSLGTRLVGNAVPIGLGRAVIRAAIAA